MEEKPYNAPDADGSPPDRWIPIYRKDRRRSILVCGIGISWIVGAIVGAILFVPTLPVREFSPLLFWSPLAIIGISGSIITLAIASKYKHAHYKAPAEFGERSGNSKAHRTADNPDCARFP